MNIALSEIIPIPIAEMPAHATAFPVSFTVAPGEKVLISSSSGKGKTSLIHFLYGLRKDFHGNITLDGNDILSLPPLEWAQLRTEKISVVFQDLRLFDDLTAMDNIQLKASLTGTVSGADIMRMADKLGIGSFLTGRPAGKLSFGQKQRVAIVRALVQPFELLLLDEPFSHLDEENSRKAWDLLREESEKRGASIILTSLGGAVAEPFGRVVAL